MLHCNSLSQEELLYYNTASLAKRSLSFQSVRIAIPNCIAEKTTMDVVFKKAGKRGQQRVAPQRETVPRTVSSNLWFFPTVISQQKSPQTGAWNGFKTWIVKTFVSSRFYPRLARTAALCAAARNSPPDCFVEPVVLSDCHQPTKKPPNGGLGMNQKTWIVKTLVPHVIIFAWLGQRRFAPQRETVPRTVSSNLWFFPTVISQQKSPQTGAFLLAGRRGFEPR